MLVTITYCSILQFPLALKAEEPEVLNAPPGENFASQNRQSARPKKRQSQNYNASPSVSEVAPKPSKNGLTVFIKTSSHRPDIKDIEKDKCFAIDQIEIRGIELINAQNIQKVVQPLAYNCLGNELAKNIIAAINKAYADEGYITSQGYVSAGHDIVKTRRFVVDVIIGRIGHVKYAESDANESLQDAYKRTKESKNPWQFASGLSGMLDSLDNSLDRFQILDGQSFDTVKRWMVMPVGERDPLQLDMVQQGLDQMNKASSSHASVKLEAAEEPNTSHVIISNPMQDSFRLFAGYEINGGSINGLGTTTSDRFKIDVAKDNLIGINDTWSGSIASGLDSNELRGSVSLPVRWWTFSFTQGYSESMQVIGESIAEYYVRTYTTAFTASYLAWRTKDFQLSVDSSLSYRRKERFVDSLELAKQTVPSARLGISGIKKFDNQYVGFGIGVSHGLRWWDATVDARDIHPSMARAQYWKIDGSLNYSIALENIGVLKADITAQWSPRPLYQDDQITVGSPSTVRGYTNTAVTIDRGFVLRTEYAPAIPYGSFLDIPKDEKTEPDFLAAVLPPLQPYVFVDYGYGYNIADQTDVSRASIGGGVRYRYGRLTFDVSGAQPVYRKGLKGDQKAGPEVFLTLSVKAF